ncbi:MAG: hypothetical protein IPK98_16370 [Chloracidobacterium sp.]|nr:hypothetical protein [Chloracidobacterium sp.]
MVPYLDIFNETVIVARPAENTISILNPTFRSVSNGNWTSTATWDYGAFSRPHDVVIPNGRTVNINVVSTVSSLTINCAGAVTGASATGYIIGNIHKRRGIFIPTGTANGYSG